jgi:hypothetical protein
MIMRHKILVAAAAGLFAIIVIWFAAFGGSGPGASGPGASGPVFKPDPNRSAQYNAGMKWGIDYLNNHSTEDLDAEFLTGIGVAMQCLSHTPQDLTGVQAHDWREGCADGLSQHKVDLSKFHHAVADPNDPKYDPNNYADFIACRKSFHSMDECTKGRG